MKVDESRQSGQKWIKVGKFDESGQKLMKVDKNGLELIKVDGSEKSD